MKLRTLIILSIITFSSSSAQMMISKIKTKNAILGNLGSAIAWSRFDEAEELLKQVSINDQFASDGCTVIMQFPRSLALVKWTLNHGADVFIINYNGKTLYDYAAENSDALGSEIFCFLMQHNKELKQSYKKEILSSLQEMLPELADIILSYFPTPSQENINHVLYVASKSFEVSHIRYLLHNGGNANYTYQDTTLIKAVIYEAIDPKWIYGMPKDQVFASIEILLKHGAPFRPRDQAYVSSDFKAAVLLHGLAAYLKYREENRQIDMDDL